MSELEAKELIAKFKCDLEHEEKEKLKKDEEEIVKKIKTVSKFDEFYQLPLLNIINIIENIDNSTDEYFELIKNLFQKIFDNHKSDKNILNLLKAIKCNSNTFTFNEIMNLLSIFNNINIFQSLYQLYKEDLTSPIVDYDYELEQKEKQIHLLQGNLFKMINEKHVSYILPPSESKEEITKSKRRNDNVKKPFFYEPDIFKAIEKGKETSVTYLIEHEGVDVNFCDSYMRSLLSIANILKQTKISEYLISQGAFLTHPKKKSEGSQLIIGLVDYSGGERIKDSLKLDENDNFSGHYNKQLNINGRMYSAEFKDIKEIFSKFICIYGGWSIIFKRCDVIVYHFIINNIQTLDEISNFIYNSMYHNNTTPVIIEFYDEKGPTPKFSSVQIRYQLYKTIHCTFKYYEIALHDDNKIVSTFNSFLSDII